MKVLFIGDGKHDIGSSEVYATEPYPARGVIPLLCRRVVPAISSESVALRWAEIVRLQPGKRGHDAKAKAARLIAERRVDGCRGLILVADNDGDRESDRLEKLRAAKGGTFLVACGVAVESIEAWTLGAPAALAEVLGAAPAEVQRAIGDRPVESLKSGSPRPPKAVLADVAAIGHRAPDTRFREEVAERTDVEDLCGSCPRGFEPFARDLRDVFGDSR